MKILIVGGYGSVGRRYQAICRYLGHKVEVHDLEMDLTPLYSREFDRAIIASPTPSHYGYVRFMIDSGRPFLCEKPMTKSLDEAAELSEYDRGDRGSVVNNYSFLVGDEPLLHYDYYNHGKDELYWDCCQLIYLDVGCVLEDTSPIFTLTDDQRMMTLDDVEKSYVTMVDAWLKDDKERLWNLEEGYKMTKAVLDRYEREGSDRHTGTK